MGSKSIWLLSNTLPAFIELAWCKSINRVPSKVQTSSTWHSRQTQTNATSTIWTQACLIHKTARSPESPGTESLGCCDCTESGLLNANPSKSHLCLSCRDLWTLSSSLVPHPCQYGGREGRGGVKPFLHIVSLSPSLRSLWAGFLPKSSSPISAQRAVHYLFPTDR